jgi:hypothetical protein
VAQQHAGVPPVVAVAAPGEQVLSRCAGSIPPCRRVDIGQEVAASLGSRQRAWRFIRRFAESWLTPLADDGGRPEADLRAVEQRLGLRLPAAIREAYALFGRREDLTSILDWLLGLEELEVDATGEVLIYRVENQSVAVWGVPLAAIQQPDPPVVVARTSRTWAGSRSGAVFVGVRGDGAVGVAALCPVAVERQPGVGPSRPCAGCATLCQAGDPRLPVWALPGGSVRWFTGPEVLLCDFAGTWLWVRARTTLALDAVRAALPGQWLMLPDV